VTSSQPPFTRAIVIVMDSVGIGELPDAASYGDQGSNTVGNIHKRVQLKIPTLRSLGLDRLVQIDVPGETAEGAEAAENAQKSFGKDFSASFAVSAVPSGPLGSRRTRRSRPRLRSVGMRSGICLAILPTVLLPSSP